MRVRRDRLGRRIGRNWWREYNCQLLAEAEAVWQARRESGDPILSTAVPGADHNTGFNQLEDADYRRIHPRPTLREFLVSNAGFSKRGGTE